MKYLIKPLTKRMFAHLRNGRAKELSATARNTSNTDDYKGSLRGLCRRGLVDIQTVTIDGKEIVSVFITKSGINFLDRYEEDARKSGSI